MKNKRALGIAGGVFILLAVSFFSLRYLKSDPFWNIEEAGNPAAVAGTGGILIEEDVEEESLPSRLFIPKINVQAEIEHVGVDWKGNMAVPKGPQNVAWYKYGSLPGNPGNAVIAGHVEISKGKGIFQDLNQLEIGDEIAVFDNQGKESLFKVVKKASYDIKTAPIEEIFGNTDRTRLNLVTCAGTWLSIEKTYSNRLVVYTELIPENSPELSLNLNMN